MAVINSTANLLHLQQHTKATVARMCELTTTFFSCGHIKSRNVQTSTCANPSTCVKDYKEANDPMPYGDTACDTPPSS
ncbi:hypothetical protein AOQ84DRAFT_371710 [Glonium stellatum]|uniref:Uncharacterized protein n=1 Tax=Glonium stellatum TaxID=574774 RepID=A0A8E2JYB0_9PEZI|nr:hypothetical protein AOQ84DRAFT_371710 [Glonium stellatum]